MAKFQPGQSGNPKGRPKGIVATQVKLRRAIESHAPGIIEQMVKRAEKGAPDAGRFLINKILPDARSMPLSSPVELAGTPAEQAEAVKALLGAGRITLEEGEALLRAIADVQAITDATELARRVAALEETLARLTAPDGDA